MLERGEGCVEAGKVVVMISLQFIDLAYLVLNFS